MRRYILILLLLCLALTVHATPPAQLGSAIDQFITDFRGHAGCRNAKVGVVVRSLDDGSLWYAKRADALFIPASTAKLVTASLALQYLTADYRFSTRLLTDGNLTPDGTLHGNLIVQGGGDPTLLSEDLYACVQELATGNSTTGLGAITHITGRILLDGSCFPCTGPQWGPGWEDSDLLWSYAAPACALSCNRNALRVMARGTTPGTSAAVSLEPATGLYTVVNRTKTSTAVTAGSLTVSRTGTRLLIAGLVAPDVELSERISIPNPEGFLTEQLTRALTSVGITLSATPETCAPSSAERTLLVSHQSAPLADVLTLMLKDSDNHIAEQLRWTLLAQQSAPLPSAKRYANLLHEFACQLAVKSSTLQLVDGSGLSRLSHVSPATLVQVLVTQAASPSFDVLWQALPIAGVDGTMQHRLQGTAADGNVHAKTGTMRGVSSLAGYVTSARGERLAFAVMVNGYSSGAAFARTLQDAVANYLAASR
ncbi:MAG TPA: D-alanyl-D-alanine carboxypeptidase/D-alanyl-D-alanine-endopeptidase [Armatimonadota bacterium]|jgi:D-alanyl-D-alanine carboxypeptidase/D-alanyl-D-alanine-endopeptidase (penicillin-binding protein 4)